MALAAPRNTRQAIGNQIVIIAAGTIYAGGIVCANASGSAVAAADTAGLKVIGIAQNSVVSGESVTVRRGSYCLVNDTAQPVTVAQIGKIVYIKDDETVTLIAGCTNGVVAGILLGFEGAEPIVAIGNIAIRPPIAPIANTAAAAAACAGGSTPSASQVDTAVATAVAPLVTSINAILAAIQA